MATEQPLAATPVGDGRALCTGTGPFFTPAIGRGRGGGVTCHPKKCSWWVMGRDTLLTRNTPSAPPPPPFHPTHPHTHTHHQEPTPQAAGTEYFSLDVAVVPAAGLRPGVLAEPWPQERVQRHTLELVVDFVCCSPLVQILDAPVPQLVEQLPDVHGFFDKLSTFPEQVIEVPKIPPEDVSFRAVLRLPAAGRTAGGSADDPILFFSAAEYGAKL